MLTKAAPAKDPVLRQLCASDMNVLKRLQRIASLSEIALLLLFRREHVNQIESCIPQQIAKLVDVESGDQRLSTAFRRSIQLLQRD
jgi:hypothetical protein